MSSKAVFINYVRIVSPLYSEITKVFNLFNNKVFQTGYFLQMLQANTYRLSECLIGIWEEYKSNVKSFKNYRNLAETNTKSQKMLELMRRKFAVAKMYSLKYLKAVEKLHWPMKVQKIQKVSNFSIFTLKSSRKNSSYQKVQTKMQANLVGHERQKI